MKYALLRLARLRDDHIDQDAVSIRTEPLWNHLEPAKQIGAVLLTEQCVDFSREPTLVAVADGFDVAFWHEASMPSLPLTSRNLKRVGQVSQRARALWGAG